MTKEEYIFKVSELEVAMNNLKRDYIESNQPYPIGAKVHVTYKDGSETTCIVKDYKIDCWDMVKPVFAKVKKDGTAHSTAEEFVPWYDVKEIEVIND